MTCSRPEEQMYKRTMLKLESTYNNKPIEQLQWMNNVVEMSEEQIHYQR